MSARYTVQTAVAQALAAATAETLLLITAPTGLVYRLAEWSVGFDGVTAANVPVLVELVSSDGTTGGTATTQASQQIEGATRAALATAERAFTAEPTVLAVLKPYLVDPNKGIIIVQNPLIREFQRNSTPRILGLRVTAPDIVNVRGYMEWEEE